MAARRKYQPPVLTPAQQSRQLREQSHMLRRAAHGDTHALGVYGVRPGTAPDEATKQYIHDTRLEKIGQRRELISQQFGRHPTNVVPHPAHAQDGKAGAHPQAQHAAMQRQPFPLTKEHVIAGAPGKGAEWHLQQAALARSTSEVAKMTGHWKEHGEALDRAVAHGQAAMHLEKTQGKAPIHQGSGPGGAPNVHEQVHFAERMYGTGSKQHLAAQAKSEKAASDASMRARNASDKAQTKMQHMKAASLHAQAAAANPKYAAEHNRDAQFHMARAHAIQVGAKGGRFYIGAGGQKVYDKK